MLKHRHITSRRLRGRRLLPSPQRFAAAAVAAGEPGALLAIDAFERCNRRDQQANAPAGHDHR
jgi:hypothetical protein